MRLKKLILQGFKSFADRTEFVFDSPITGIVGPNGCGKSNVVDGFKWVLGEQSAKSLRGDAMMDVIFNGSGNRKPAGMAEVVLVFENPRRADDTRLLNVDTDEVAVGRRLFRDGTSEYQLNNTTCRLKDVRELFLDTGVGVDAYSVIEQGRVAALLEANPEERRLIFEEAAGISKYKVKKKEAQRKLEKVDQNLLRVNDIVEEVEKRLRSVKIQAGRARTYQEHSARLSELRLGYSLQEYHTLHEQSVELDKRREDTQFRLDDITGDLARKQNELASRREQLETLTQKKQSAEFELVQAKATMQSAQQKQQYAQQQLEQIAEQLAVFEQDRAALEIKRKDTDESLEAETKILEHLTGELEEHRARIEHHQQAFRDGQLKLADLGEQVEKHKAAILDLMRNLATVNSRLGAIEIERKNIAAQQSRLADRRRVVLDEIEKLDAQRGDIQARLDAALAEMSQHQAQVESKRGQAAVLDEQIAQVAENLAAAREHRSGLVSRQNLLTDLESKREGVSEGVQSVLRQRDDKFSFIRGLVADVLRVDVEHAHVIEAALDGRDQWLIADDAAAAIAPPEILAGLEGRVNILRTNEGSPASLLAAESAADEYDWNQHSHRIRLAIDLVRFEPADVLIARQLLGRTVVVDDLYAAAELHVNAPAGFRFVTRSGEVLEADGTLRAGPLTAAMGLISRRSELEAIAQQITDVDARIESLTTELAAGNAEANALEEDLNTLRNAIYQLNTAKVQLTSQIAQMDDRRSALLRERPLLDRELQGLFDQTGRLQSEDTHLVQKRQDLDAEQTSRQEQVVAATEEHQKLADDLKHWNEELTASRVLLGQIQEKQLASQQQVQRQAAMQSELAQQVERVERSAKSVASRRGAVEDELANAKREEHSLVEKQQALAASVETLTAAVLSAHQESSELTSQVESIRGEHSEIEHSLHDIQMKLGELRVRLETLVQRTLDELQLDLPAKYTEGYEPAAMDWEAVGNEIKELREKIHRLGNVNLDAIGEQDELEQRSQFYATQLTDLANSKQQLEELINTINVESGLRFEQTFNAVREHFQSLFRKLFGGGKADVFLETEIDDPAGAAQQQPVIGPDGQTVLPIMKKTVDPLEAGIEIIARPPGKQPVSISQLSGGEKTMTCVALLLSIFKSKPSPFCILDEVDAALDEANNQRFNLIVQEFLDQSQFIVITHSKRTMQIADVLYGVTMQEQGVSKRVAVKFDQVDGQGRIAETAAA